MGEKPGNVKKMINILIIDIMETINLDDNKYGACKPRLFVLMEYLTYWYCILNILAKQLWNLRYSGTLAVTCLAWTGLAGGVGGSWV